MQASNICAFSERMLCEYNSIFPTIAALLDHLLFTVGNGYDLNEDTGMLVDFSGVPINEYPRLTDADWAQLIADGHKKEEEYFSSFSKSEVMQGIYLEYLADQKAKYLKREVTDDMFTELRLHSDLLHQAETLKNEKFTDKWLRPYPLSMEYSRIFQLNENTPNWFILIALNFCNAWVSFLANEIETGNLCTTDTSDYADLAWTTKHHQMLLDLSSKFKNMLGEECITQKRN